MKAPLAVGILTLSAVVAQAQPGRPPNMVPRGSSVAYDQPAYYIQRLRPTRHYPPNLYGYVEVSGRPAASGGTVRTGR